jgi:hypothetical protein
MKQSPDSETYSRLAGQEIFPFIKPEGSLPSSQETATGPYPETLKLSPHLLRSVSVALTLQKCIIREILCPILG